MKTLSAITILILSLGFLFSCGKIQEAKNAYETVKSVAEAAEHLPENMEEMNRKTEERRAKGDTLAMHYEKLAEYLPESYGDYVKDGDLEGGSVNMTGASYSNVEQKYQSPDGNVLKIAIVDYNTAVHLYTGLMAFYGTGLEIDNTDQLMKGFEIDDEIKGWHSLKKKSNKVELIAGIANRFYVSINMDNQDNGEEAIAVISDTKIRELENL